MKTMGSRDNDHFPCFQSEQDTTYQLPLFPRRTWKHILKGSYNLEDKPQHYGHVTKNHAVNNILHQEKGKIQIFQPLQGPT